MITEDYVSFETAKLLKEKGFDEESYKFYRHIFYNNRISFENCRTANEYCTLELGSDTMTNKTLESDFWSGTQEAIIAPTLQMAMKWLREVYTIDIVITPSMFHRKYNVCIYKDENLCCVDFDGTTLSPSYEYACEAAIKYCLENLI